MKRVYCSHKENVLFRNISLTVDMSISVSYSTLTSRQLKFQELWHNLLRFDDTNGRQAKHDSYIGQD